MSVDLRTCSRGHSLRRLIGLAAGLGLAGLATGAYGQCQNFTVTTGTDVLVPGVDDIGNHVDDGTTLITLPFTFNLYGTPYGTVNASSNGNLQFAGTNAAYTNECFPSATMAGPTIAPHWDDQMTTLGGIFTSTSGVAPNRIFNIEWRAGYYPSTTVTLNYEVRLYEGTPTKIDFVYGTVPQGGSGATVGVQASAAGPFNQFECNAGGITAGMKITFNCPTSFGPSCSLNAGSANQGSNVAAFATVTPGGGPTSTGIVVTLDGTDVGAAAAIPMHDDGVAPDAAPGDNIYSANVAVSAGTSVGNHNLVSTVSDAQNRTSTCSRSISVFPAGCVGEPEACGVNNPDSSDGGCNSTPNAYATANMGQNYCGQCANSTAARDTDWWMFTMPPASDTIVVTATAQFAAQSFILAPTCPAVILSPQHVNAGSGDLSYTYSGLSPGGNYVFFMSPQGFDGSAICGQNDAYTFSLQAGATGACCSDAGCQVMTNIACAAGGGHFNGAGTSCGGGAYSITQGTGTIEPGVDDTGNHIDDGQTLISLPFAYSFYGISYNDVNVCSNGNLQFGTPTGSFTAAYTNDCLPSPAQITGAMLAPHWDDQMTNAGGIFTSTSGAAPNRIFNIEWRAGYYPDTTVVLNYEVRLYEGQAKFDVVYGTVPQGGSGATVGVQASSAGPSQSFECNSGGISEGMKLTFVFASTGDPCAPQGGCTADFNCDGDTGTDADIESFFACLAGTCPAAPCPNTADFNNDGDVGTDADIESFFRVLAGGPC